jgi:hypothetical protein
MQTSNALMNAGSMQQDRLRNWIAMADEVTPAREVVLGLDAAWGFSRSDLTSPARAGAARALVDVSLTGQPVTELRIHGVAGSTGPIVLEHPNVLQVAGDSVTGFYRRWNADGPGRASVPWKLEAYLWGGLTESPLASASWLLLASFMLYNVASFMLPSRRRPAVPTAPRADAAPGSATEPELPAASGQRGEPSADLSRTAGQWLAQALLRLLALAATVQLVTGLTTATVSTVAWQATAGELPSWLGWYVSWSQNWRIVVAVVAVGVALAAFWWLSVKTASQYEARTSTVRPERAGQWPLARPGFWDGEILVRRQRSLHLAAACASAAIVIAYPAQRLPAARWAALALAAVVLALACGLIIAPPADRHVVTLANRDGRSAATWPDRCCRAVLGFAIAALAVSTAVIGLSDQAHVPQHGALPGLTGFSLLLLITQLALFAMLSVTVAVLAWRARTGAGQPAGAATSEGFRPYLRGWLAPVLTGLALLLGGLLTAVATFGIARALGHPVPSGFKYQPPPAVAVPWPIYALGAAPVGMLLGGLVAGAVLYRKYRRDHRRFEPPAGAGPSQVAAAYAGHSAPGSGAGKEFAGNRGKIAGVWAVGLLADDAGVAMLLLVAGGVLAVLAAEVWAFVRTGGTGTPPSLTGDVTFEGAISVIALISALVAGVLVTLLRSAYSSPTDRRIIGALWDVATFWPRAVHPLAPPCYGERAVPEVVDRVRLLTGRGHRGPGDSVQLVSDAEQPDLSRSTGLVMPAGPVLLTGYSQGSIIAAAVIAQLPADVRRDVALLTLACPARRLYGRAFPEYFSDDQLDTLNVLVGGAAGTAGRWRNLVRRSDYLGSWIFRDPEPRLDPDDMLHNIDQPGWDPVVLVPDRNPTPPPVHRHDGWWQDPRGGEVGAYLVGRLLP